MRNAETGTISGSKLYFKSDETNTRYGTYYYGKDAGVADKNLAWALNRIYYIYCEAKNPRGNDTTYFNRCIRSLIVYSRLNTKREVFLEFTGKSGKKMAKASNPRQAASTLIQYLVNTYGDVDFNDLERETLLTPSPASIW